MGTIYHFSHDHLLRAGSPNASPPCSFCKSSKCTSKGVYACYNCRYFLGSICAMLKKQTNVPAHQQHPLNLVQPSATENASRSCRACGVPIPGLRYSCSCNCNYHLHAVCALWPTTIRTSNHQHQLYLNFPAGRGEIRCNGCGEGDQGLWGYDCGTNGCGFYLHLGCVAKIGPSRRSCNPMDLLDDLLDVIDTLVDVADKIWDQTQLNPPHSSTVQDPQRTNEDSDDCCGDDSGDCC